MIKINTCAFTGHRPSKLGGYDYSSQKNLKIKNKTKEIVEQLITNNNVKSFVFGGALGFDQIAFDAVYELKEKYTDIVMVMAVPFSTQDCKWPQKSREYWANQKEKADKVVLVDKLDDYKIKGYEEDIYYPAKMQKRNEYMADVSNFLVACYDGTGGGTGNCVNYWNKTKDKENLYSFNPNEL